MRKLLIAFAVILICTHCNKIDTRVISVEKMSYYLIKGDITGFENGVLEITDNDNNLLGYQRHGFHLKENLNRFYSAKIFTGNNDQIKINFYYDTKKKIINGDIQIERVNEENKDFVSPYATLIDQKLSLPPFNAKNYHSNILLICRYINSILISPLRNYYDLKESPERKKEFLGKEEIQRKIFNKEINIYLPDFWFDEYSSLSILESSKAYCQKSSLSSYEVLGQFNIPTRQIHFTDDSEVGFHQFFEYWNPYLNKFIIVDPFYGITYKGNNGELLGFDEFKELMVIGEITHANIKHEDIEHFYFLLEELAKGWSANLKSALIGDSRMTYAH